MRTTGLQVSGYSFLLRRLELALVTGDPRMAHDPLRTQRRAMAVGVLLALLVVGAMLVMAMLRPSPSMGDATFLADESGSLYVRLDQQVHPVTNVVSARLVLGEPVEAAATTSAQLAGFQPGPPVGLPDVPGLVAAAYGDYDSWALCGTTVVTDSSFLDAGPQIVVADSGTWLVVNGTRLLIPHRGDIVARALAAVPVHVEETVVSVLRRGPDLVLPTGESGLPGDLSEQGAVVSAGDRAFLVIGGGLAEVTGARRTVVEALSTANATASDNPGTAHGVVAMELSTVLTLPGSSETGVFDHLPVDLVVQPVEEVCAGSTLMTGTSHGAYRPDSEQPRHYSGPRETAALTTERGLILVSGSGVRYTVGSPQDLAALGILGDGELPVEVPWAVIERLPDGGLLSADRARRTVEVE